jgi:carbon starvation protein CstA
MAIAGDLARVMVAPTPDHPYYRFNNYMNGSNGIFAIAALEIDTAAGRIAGIAIMFILLLTLAGLAGPFVAHSPVLAPWFTFGRKPLALVIPAYGFLASVLPVWLLLCPRDYLSTYLKIGTILALIVGICFLHPTLQMPPVTRFYHGGGPVIPGAAMPFLFITIACGAVSGFHSIIATGTTPKMIPAEKDILFVGYGAMVTTNYLPAGHYLLSGLAITVMLLMAAVFALAVRRWIQLLRIAERVQDTWGETVLQIVQE